MNRLKDTEKGLVGILSIKVIEASTGKVVDSFTDKNLIVNGGKENITKLLGGSGGYNLNTVGVGTNATAPDVSDTELTPSGENTVGIDGVSYPDFSTVMFEFTIGTDVANGLEINEFGLFDDAGNLFSRKVRATISKTSSIILVGTWQITIA
jgi:hypothetical protein